jgi:hypothetical protein
MSITWWRRRSGATSWRQPPRLLTITARDWIDLFHDMQCCDCLTQFSFILFGDELKAIGRWRASVGARKACNDN